MRQHLALLVVGALATPAAAAPSEPPLKKLDMKKRADKLVVFKDDIGKFYLSPLPNRDSTNDAEELLFYSADGKTFYQQPVIAFSVEHDPGTKFEWVVWSPRVRGRNNGRLVVTPTEMFVGCKSNEKRNLTQLSADQARKLVEKATFYEPFWRRETKFLARDDDGVYYFVDALTEKGGGGGYRVFVGKKGAMKQLPMTNVVSDSAGEIYATKSGELKFVTEGAKAYWKKGGKKTELVVLPPLENRYLIYRELGNYGQLGTICEDQ